VLNEGRDDDPEGDLGGYLWVPVRICAAVREEFGHEALGPHVGTPIVATTRQDGTRVAFFGPVMSRVPTGELWDATLVLAGSPGFHELKAAVHAEPDLG